MNPNFGYGGYQLPPGFIGIPPVAGTPGGAPLPTPQTQAAVGATTNNGGASPQQPPPPMMPIGVGVMPNMPNLVNTDAAAAAFMAGVPVAAMQMPEKKAKVHYCTIHPEGMPRSFEVPFTERRLPVCDRCKKNFKSRDLCRKRDGHRALPWQMTYVVVTLDSSIINEDENGNMTVRNVPMVCELQDIPLLCLGPADGSMKPEPICKVCREKNYTRDYCRNTCKHTTPPWSTTFVKLLADTKLKEDDRFMQYSVKKRKVRQEDDVDGKPKRPEGEVVAEKGHEKSDDLSIVHKSRTLLCSVSSTKLVARWCERIRFADKDPALEVKKETTAENATALPFSSPYGAPGTSSQTNNAQLWDAFRAGALWAQSQGAQCALPPVMHPGFPFNPASAPPFFLGNADEQASWPAVYGPVDPSVEPQMKKLKTDNDDASVGICNLDGDTHNVTI